MKTKRRQFSYLAILIVTGILLDLAGNRLVRVLGLPLYFDCVGIILSAVLGGAIPGIIVGYISNIINGFSDPTNMYYAFTSVLIAFCAARFGGKGYFKHLKGCLIAIVTFALIGGGIGSVISWLLFGFDIEGVASTPFAGALIEEGLLSPFWAHFLMDLLLDLADKTLHVAVVVLILRFIPEEVRERFAFRGWKQRPLAEEERLRAEHVNTRGMSLRSKIVLLVGASTLFMAVATTGICVLLYHRAFADLGMVWTNEVSFITRVVTLFFGFFLIILAIGLWIAEYSLLLPVNAMTDTAGEFACNTEQARDESVEHFRELEIATGDEIENLYNSFASTMASTVAYFDEAQRKTATLTRMQNGLILVLADLVESRDKCTGDHVRKTAAYVRIILEELDREQVFPGIITEEYIEDVANSAPLHDVGKISVPDQILNKPGKLTEEEFEIMKGHTTAGNGIISKAIALVSESGYLHEARNLSTYHHEKWNGTGYPEGLQGEEIPLSARIMAVADVFDALVSRRSYKEPFSFEKAISIIEEGSGSHFDPRVVHAFLEIREEAHEIYETNME